jgi:hypothetical protein
VVFSPMAPPVIFLMASVYVWADGPPFFSSAENPLVLFCNVAYCDSRLACSGGSPFRVLRQSPRLTAPFE